MLGTVEPGSSLVSPACLLSSEHLALASTFVPMQADFFFFLVLFFLVLTRARSLSCYSGSMNILLLMEKLIRPSHLVVCLTAVSVKGSDHVSLLSMQLPPLFLFFFSEYNRVTKCLEWRFTAFIDLDFKPLVCFEECINQRDWHQRAFHWVQKTREPLKIARLCCNELL